MTTANSIHEFTVTGMTCGHCSNAVSSEIAKIAGVTNVDVDLASGVVRVESSAPVDRQLVAAAVDEAGYELAS
jgi:copper chaperone